MYRHSAIKAKACDEITQFGLRPVEILKLFAMPGDYFRWFHIGENNLPLADIMNLLARDDIEVCAWIDGLGRRVLLRRNAFREVTTYLESLNSSEFDGLDTQLDIERLKVLLLRLTKG